jgi:hypothetical protein
MSDKMQPVHASTQRNLWFFLCARMRNETSKRQEQHLTNLKTDANKFFEVVNKDEKQP